jgi:tRNA pseudouridine32 synthase / 23S rRNA pseudouridine746 synthase
MSEKISVLFENEFCVVVDKPAGWLSVPGRTANDTRIILGHTLEKQMGHSLFPIHRLDAEVSGAILYGKTKEFHRDANVGFEHRTIHKSYQAVTDLGPFKKGETCKWISKIVRGKKRSFEANHGKQAITEATVIERTDSYLDWRLHPITGRPHQLRFELTKHLCPIFGDVLYGSQKKWPLGGIALRSIQLKFPAEFSEKWALPEFVDAPTFKVNDDI